MSSSSKIHEYEYSDLSIVRYEDTSRLPDIHFKLFLSEGTFEFTVDIIRAQPFVDRFANLVDEVLRPNIKEQGN